MVWLVMTWKKIQLIPSELIKLQFAEVDALQA